MYRDNLCIELNNKKIEHFVTLETVNETVVGSIPSSEHKLFIFRRSGIKTKRGVKVRHPHVMSCKLNI